MKIKKGDTVKVITGKYKGTIGEVLECLPKEEKVIVEGVNVAKKHMKPSQQNPDGGIVEKNMPIHVSNVMAYDSKSKKAYRVGYTTEKNGDKVRVYKGTNTKIK